MRLASFNLFSGRSLDTGAVDVGALEAAVRELDADVVGIQEVDRDQPRSGGTDQAAVVAAAGGAVAWRFVPALFGTPGESWWPADAAPAAGAGTGSEPATPAYGIGLVSRLPVRAWHEVRLAAAPVRSPVIVPSPDGGRPRPLLIRDEQRVGLAAVVELPGGGTLTVANTHLSFVPGWNVVQLRRLVRGLAEIPGPLVLLGDLNLPGVVPAKVLRGWRNLAPGLRTYPSPQPRIQFDHAFARPGTDLRVRSVATPRLAVSDHRALVLDVSG